MKKNLLFVLLLVACSRSVEIGKHTEYYPDGQLKKVYKIDSNGKLDSITTIWYKSGVVSARIHYKNGEFHGDFVTYWENGNKSTEQKYDKGQLEGGSITYNLVGDTIKFEWYHNGKLMK